MAIDRDTAVGVLDVASGEIERIDIGDAARAVDDPVDFGRVFGTPVSKDHAQAAVRRLDALDADTGLDADTNAFALGLEAGDRVGIHRRQ